MNSTQLINCSETYGTPLYVYDTEVIQQQYQLLTEAFKLSNVKFFYACKALSNINILQFMQHLGLNLDCVSINEIYLGLHAGFKPEQIIFTPNCVDLAEIEQAKELNVNLNIDNISLLEQFGNKYGNTYPVCIRINPHIMAGGNSKISTGHIDSKFGISIHQLRHLNRIVKTTNLVVHGLHMHTGSEIKDIEVFIRGLELLLEITHDFPDLRFLDLGSGFKIAYQNNDYTTDLISLAKRINETMHSAMLNQPRQLELWFEPGKYLVSAAGVFLVHANVIKQTTATTFIGVNSGFNHFIRPMFYDSYHHISNLSNLNGPKRIYTVVGNLCETDTFAIDRKINEVHEGDILAIHNAGAYGFEMSSSFNSRTRPAEVILYQQQAHLIRSAETYADLLRHQHELNLFTKV